MSDNDSKKRERLCDLTTDELWEIACEADGDPDLSWSLDDAFDIEDD